MTISDTTAVKMSIRNAVTERWNSEIIWANTNSMSGHMQTLSQARVDPDKKNNAGARSMLAPTMQIAEKFYTNHGRAEERSVGKECVSTCRARGSPDN